jgi:hypothetical protein
LWMQRWIRRLHIVSDTIALVIWLIAGVAGGDAADEFLKGKLRKLVYPGE